jgi:hypothetical protein
LLRRSPAKIILEGLQVDAPPGRVRLVLFPYCVEVAQEDVLSVAALPERDGYDRTRATAVRAEVAAGARLFALADATPYDDLLTQRQPFAVSARGRHTFDPDGDGLASHEAAFFQRHGFTRPAV